MRDLLDVTSDEEGGGGEEGASPNSSHNSSSHGKQNHQEFIFGYSSAMTTLRILHPHPAQVMTYWNIFKDNIDPVLRLLHKPSIEKMFMDAVATGLEHLPRATEALMFAVYLSVIVSMTPQECLRRLEQDKEVALARYRYAAEQALAKAGFMETQEFRVMQALVLFLIGVRRYDGTTFVWTMIGVALRTSQRLGLHRDGSCFGINAFDTEERRRLFWQLISFGMIAWLPFV